MAMQNPRLRLDWKHWISMIEIIVIIIAVFTATYLLLIRCRKGHAAWSDFLGWDYTHRGLYGDGIPENSMKAFRKAKEAGYGIELDVHLLADGNLAIIHDSSIKRMTNADVLIEDLSADQLNEYYLENSLETIPNFADVLSLIDGAVPLIVELKCVRNNYVALCEAVCKLLDSYKGAYCLESFDPRCIRWLKNNRPEILRGQLSEDYFKSPNSKLPWYLKFMLVHHLYNFMTVPDFVAYKYSDRRKLSNYLCKKVWGAKGIVWTVKTKDEYCQAKKEDWISIFEGFIP